MHQYQKNIKDKNSTLFNEQYITHRQWLGGYICDSDNTKIITIYRNKIL